MVAQAREASTRRAAFSWLCVLIGLGSSTEGGGISLFGELGKQRTTPLVPSDRGFPYIFKTLPREFQNVPLVASKGALPSWVNGDFLKTGFCGFEEPGEQGRAHESPSWRFSMLFDVLGCGYRLSFRNGELHWWAKKARTKYYNESLLGPPRYRIFKDVEPARSAWDNWKAFWQFDNSDNLNVNMVMLSTSAQDHVVAISDVEGELEFDLDTMNTLGMMPWADELSRDARKVVNTCAHPSKIADDPALYNYLNRMDVSLRGMTMSYQFYKIDPFTASEGGGLKRTIVAEVPMQKHHYVHHFSQTPNFIIIVEMPFFWNIPVIVTGTTIKPALYFDPSQGVTVKVIRTSTGVLEHEFSMPDESFFCFHHINAFEDENGDLHADLATYDDIEYHLSSFELGGHHANNTHDLPPGTFRRVSLPIRTGGEAYVTKIGSVDLELPIVNQNYRGRPYRYAFAHSKSRSNRANNCKSGPGRCLLFAFIDPVSPVVLMSTSIILSDALNRECRSGCGGTWWDSIVKVDVETGNQQVWRRDDHWPSEPAFVPRPGAIDEDDGLILDVVTWAGDDGLGAAYLVVLDAKTMKEIAEFPLPSHVPYQSHGNWFPTSVATNVEGYHRQRGSSMDSSPQVCDDS